MISASDRHAEVCINRTLIEELRLIPDFNRITSAWGCTTIHPFRDKGKGSIASAGWSWRAIPALLNQRQAHQANRPERTNPGKNSDSNSVYPATTTCPTKDPHHGWPEENGQLILASRPN
jgi:hypothetical protein